MKELVFTYKENKRTFNVEVTPFTIIQYNKIFGADLFNDITIFNELIQDYKPENFGKVCTYLFQILYICSSEEVEKKTFQQFLKSIDIQYLYNAQNIVTFTEVLSTLISEEKSDTQN